MTVKQGVLSAVYPAECLAVIALIGRSGVSGLCEIRRV